MNVVLVQLPVAAERMYPIGLAGLAAVLREAGHRVRGIDLQFEGLSDVARMAREDWADWFGLALLPQNVTRAREVIRTIRGISSAPIFVTGALPRIDPGRVPADLGADAILVGPPERDVLALLDAPVRTGSPAARACVQGPPKTSGPPLCGLPPMDRTVFPLKRYGAAMRSTAYPYAVMVTSRGCDDHCPWCPVPVLQPEGFDARSPVQIHQEMRALALDFGIRCIHIEDDAFLARRERVLELAALLRDDPLPLRWELVNGVPPDHLDPELLGIMATAGCSRVVIGFEHVGRLPPPLRSRPFLSAWRLVRDARAQGLRVGGYFMVGLPGVGLPRTLKGVVMALALPLDDANFTAWYPLPGTAMGGHGDRSRATRLVSTVLSLAAQAAFFHKPRPLLRMAADLWHRPDVGPALRAKARELMFGGGPVPLREMW